MPILDGTGVVLASASPRRRELLAAIGIEATIAPADIDERIDPAEDPESAVLRLATTKARAIADRRGRAIDRGGEVVLAADTVVVDGSETLGKPTDHDEAEAMLHRLAGRTHAVLTGVCAIRGARVEQLVTRTEVTMRPLDHAEISAYVASGDADDKAGAYGIQGAAGAFVTEVRGSFSGVVGLPLSETVLALRRLGVDVVPHAVPGLGSDITSA